MSRTLLDNSLDIQAEDTQLGGLRVLPAGLHGHLGEPGAAVDEPVVVLLIDVRVTLRLECLADTAQFIPLGSEAIKLRNILSRFVSCLGETRARHLSTGANGSSCLHVRKKISGFLNKILDNFLYFLQLFFRISPSLIKPVVNSLGKECLDVSDECWCKDFTVRISIFS